MLPSKTGTIYKTCINSFNLISEKNLLISSHLKINKWPTRECLNGRTKGIVEAEGDPVWAYRKMRVCATTDTQPTVVCVVKVRPQWNRTPLFYVSNIT